MVDEYVGQISMIFITLYIDAQISYGFSPKKFYT